jgi:NADH-quinone oxidoreductase subunit I
MGVVELFGSGLLKGLGITAKHTYEKEITHQYPEERPVLQQRYRGSLEYDFPKCIACGLCITACPNNVLTLDTFKDENSKKKQVDKYTIDLQYCLFCNLCVEICPTDTLYFSKNFELTQINRDSIKKVYHRPPGLNITKEKMDSLESPQLIEPSDAGVKRQKQLEALKTALGKNPSKTLARILSTEEDITTMTELINEDDKILSKLAELMVDDRDKAAKVASAWIKKAKQKNAAKEENQHEL